MTSPTPAERDAAYGALIASDPVLARLADRFGRPDPFAWADADEIAHSRGIGGHLDAMVLHILRQQVSLASADAAYDRLTRMLGGPVTADALAAADPDALRAAGLTRQKSGYLLGLAQRQVDGRIDLDGLDHLSDADAVTQLTRIPGVGRWTAEVFLINQLHRADVLPAADIGLQRAAQREYGLEARPDEPALRRLGEAWAPLRTYAATLLWYSLPEVHGRIASAERG